jgi:tRNA (mo5U34)-methyltransferase
LSTAADSEVPLRDAGQAISEVRRWYHSIEITPGLVTPGMFDLRPIVDRLPWPDVHGKRCLDVGTADGFLAFELERRGAAEVVAVDVAGWDQLDWEPDNREGGLQYFEHVFGPDRSHGFKVARELMGSEVRLQQISVYDLRPEAVGEFDVVTCGSLLLHLKDPLGALAAIRSVCRGRFLSTDQVDFARSVLRRRRPLFRLDGTSRNTQWWLPNAAGHRQLLLATGFEIERESRLYAIKYGPAHPPQSRELKWLLRSAARRIWTGNDGVPHHAVLARPA